MRQIAARNFSNLGFGSSIIVLLIVVVFAAINLRALIESNNNVSHTLIVLRIIDETLGLLANVEAGQRGYIITGEEQFLEYYDAAISLNNGISQHLQELRQLTSDNPNQQQRLDLLDPLVTEKLAFAQETIDLRRDVGFDAAQNAVLTDKGRQIMDDIRQVLAEMQNEEQELLQQRSNAASASLQYTLLTLIIGAGLSISLLSLSYYIVNREVNVRRRAEEALQQLNRELDQRVEQRTSELAASERNFRDLADSALIGIYRSMTKGEILYVNQTLAHMLGHDTPEEMTRGSALLHYSDPQVRQTFIEKLQRDGKVESYELSLLTKSGQPLTALISARINGDELTGTLLDITERKRAEEQNHFLANLVTSVSDSIIATDMQLKIQSWNAAAEAMYGWQEAEVIGEPSKNILQSEFLGTTRETVTKQVMEQGFWKGEVSQRCRDGTEILVLSSVAVYRDSQDRPAGIVAVNRDITERKRAEQDRLAREVAERASQAKNEFLSRMSHELRTPMNSILGFAQLLKMDEMTPDQLGSLEQILKSGRHLLNLINEVLDIARIESGRMTISPEPIHLDEALQSATDLIRPLADQRGISIHVRIPSSRDVFVTADRQRLKQVLLNLLSNAVKYNRENGQIYVTASLLVDGYLHLAVRDTGNGIPPEKMNRLFIPFDRLELDPAFVEGTGLGLALSKGLVEAMGGRIGAQSVLGQGSTFWLDLKLTSQQKEAIVMAEVDDYLKDAPGTSQGLVLYVEDNLSNIQLIEKILARLPNLKLVSAMQGRLALDLARLHKPGLILLDLHLPDVHGSEVFKWLRAEPETRDIPIVVMSADATPSQIEKMLAAGAQAYLTKPIDVKEFLKVVGEMLGS